MSLGGAVQGRLAGGTAQVRSWWGVRGSSRGKCWDQILQPVAVPNLHSQGSSPALQDGSAASHRARVTTDHLQKVAVERMARPSTSLQEREATCDQEEEAEPDCSGHIGFFHQALPRLLVLSSQQSMK